MATSSVNVADIFARDAATDTVAVADGYGITLRVYRGHLLIDDGIGQHRRQRRYSRAQRTLRRVVILGDTGYLSLEAIRWCADLNITVVQLDRDGRLLATAGNPGRNDSRLRRAQAAAPSSEAGVAVARTLLGAKLQGQADVATDMLATATATGVPTVIHVLAEQLAAATDLGRCRDFEAQGSKAYFGAWPTAVRCHFADRNADRIPDHWGSFAARTSPLHPGGRSPRNAADPINTLLNYGYALAEVECRRAAIALGLDPSLGIVHTDKANRDSLALDLLESIRPLVEQRTLALLAVRRFRRDDFHETRQGACRLLAPLTHELAQAMPAYARGVAPHVEAVAHLLARSSPTQVPLRTPLSRANTIAQQHRGQRSANRKPPADTAPKRACRTCGGELHNQRGQLCGACWPQVRDQLAHDRAKSANSALAAIRATGADPSTAAEASTKRRSSLSRRKREELAWGPETAEQAGWTVERYQAAVLPHLKPIPLSQLQGVTGLSVSACSRIRSGLLMPHRRHWIPLATLVDEDAEHEVHQRHQQQ